MKRLILFALSISPVLHAADMQQDIKNLVVHNQTIGSMSLKRFDPIQDKLLKAIMQDKQRASASLILARVVIIDNSTDYYEAYKFNNKVFADKKLGAAETDIRKKIFIDPRSQKPIKDIRYFILRQLTDPSCISIGSNKGMMTHAARCSFVQALFNANDSQQFLKDRAEWFVRVGEKYQKGNGTSKDMEQALYWYEKAIQQSVNKRFQAQGNLYAGHFYYLGTGVKKDFKKAADYYQKAIDLQVSRGSREWALFYLANIFEQGDHGVTADYTKALSIYKDLAAETTISKLKSKAQQKIEQLEKQIQKAQVYSVSCAHQNESVKAEVFQQALKRMSSSLQKEKKLLEELSKEPLPWEQEQIVWYDPENEEATYLKTPPRDAG